MIRTRPTLLDEPAPALAARIARCDAMVADIGAGNMTKAWADLDAARGELGLRPRRDGGPERPGGGSGIFGALRLRA